MKKVSDARLWLGVAIAFGVLIAAYVVVIKVSHAAQIREVPLATGSVRP
jgi:hypothetical protein